MIRDAKIFAIFFLLIFSPFAQGEENKIGMLDTVFSYTDEELDPLKAIPVSQKNLDQNTLEAWDSFLYYISSQSLPDGLTYRLMAYVYVAQREFALLSFKLSNRWIGTPDVLIDRVIKLIYPEFNHKINSDGYSNKLGEIVFKKIEARFKSDQSHLKDYEEKVGKLVWKEKPPYIGLRLGHCPLWLISPVENFRASEPPDAHSIIWKYGLNQITTDQERLTPQQKELIYYWGGLRGAESGNWFAILNTYLHNNQVSFPKYLLVRSVFAMSYVNAMIGAFDSKYTYWVLRPNMQDRSIIEIIPCPVHPSYPSAHSATASASAFVLSSFFPSDKKKWDKLAFESANSRIWAGLHFMYDNEEGLIQGEKISRATLEHFIKE